MKDPQVVNRQKGFTLIEILVVIGIIAILAAIVIVALNPARQFAQARDTQRSSDVNTLLNAVGQRMADNRGLWTASGACPVVLPSVATNIGSGAGNTDLSCLVPTYIASMPLDPSVGTSASSSYSTGYTIQLGSNGRITISASPEITPPATISITR